MVLAAGASQRLGRPKQLVPYRGKPLLRHAVDAALAAGVGPVVVVLGAEAERIARALAGLGVGIVINREWRAGLGGSVAAGVRAAAGLEPAVAGVLLLACDQPLVTPELLRSLAAGLAAGAPVAAAGYGGTLGVPAAFERRLFPELLGLDADRGARDVIARHRDQAVSAPFPEGELDIDTAEDVLRFGDATD